MIGGPTCQFRNDALKPSRPQIQFVDEDVDHPHWMVFSHVIVEELREQDTLRSHFALNQTLHSSPRNATSQNYT